MYKLAADSNLSLTVLAVMAGLQSSLMTLVTGHGDYRDISSQGKQSTPIITNYYTTRLISSHQ